MATTTVSSGTTSSGLTVQSGNVVNVLSGGTVSSTTVSSGGLLTVQAGGVDNGATVLAGGNETVLGAANGDAVYGTQLVSAATATVNNETVYGGGVVDLYLKGVVGTGITVLTGGTLNISGNAVASNTVLNGGTLALQSAKATLTGSVTLNGTGNTLVVAALQSTSAGTYEFEGAVISGFVAGDIIDLTAVASNSSIALTSTVSGATETVNVTSGGTVLETLVFTAGTNVALGVDAAGNVEVVACYCPGTMIQTPCGGRRVEALAVGDTVVTATGEHRAIKWMGHNTVDCRDHPHPADVLPVRVRADAFGPGLPASDLWLSPGHAVSVDLLGSVLVRIGDLVNGATVVQEPVETVEYWHVELNSHDLLVANGMPAESYINVGNRAFFTDGAGLPDGAPLSLADYCHPLVLDEATLHALRARMLVRAAVLGWRVDATRPEPHLMVDGERLEPEMEGGLARFLLPPGASDVWLVTPTFVPRQVGMNGDTRPLGLHVSGIRLENGLSFRREVPAGDPLLCVGFHPRDADTGRSWTTGRSRLPAALWAECNGAFFLTVAFEPGAGMPAWRHVTRDVQDLPVRPALRLVHAA